MNNHEIRHIGSLSQLRQQLPPRLVPPLGAVDVQPAACQRRESTGREGAEEMNYNLFQLIDALSDITEVVQSGWTGDIYLDKDTADRFNNGCPVTFRHENLHYALGKMVEGWTRVETENGGVVTFTRGERP